LRTALFSCEFREKDYALYVLLVMLKYSLNCSHTKTDLV